MDEHCLKYFSESCQEQTKFQNEIRPASSENVMKFRKALSLTGSLRCFIIYK